MKLILSTLTFLFAICIQLDAQYKLNKEVYDFRDYTYQEGEPINIDRCVIASVFIPGLGHSIAGESRRGTAFLGAFSGSLILTTTGSLMMMGGGTGEELIYAGLAGAVGIYVWSITDAVKVAKVNNMVYMDRHNEQLNLRIQPYVNPAGSSLTGDRNYGLTLALTF